MRIAVYDCVSPDQLTEKYGPSGNHILRWLAPHAPEAELVRLDLPGGDALPSPTDYDGVVISGSEKGVYDDTHWMNPLRQNLLDLRAAGTPVFGICFGHQIMADVWGGKAEKADTGFVAGVRRFGFDDAVIPAYVAHQDQVTRQPPASRVTGAAGYCPIAGLAYDFPALSVQFHPEYNRAFADDLITMFGDMLMSKEEISASRDSLEEPVDSLLCGAQAADLFRSRIT